MNKYFLNNINIKKGDKIVIDCKYNPDNIFEFTIYDHLEPNYKNKIFTILNISSDDFGETLKIDTDTNYLDILFRHSVSKVNDPKPVEIPIIGKNYIIGKDISYMPYLKDRVDLYNFEFENSYNTIKDVYNNSIYDTTFTIIDYIFAPLNDNMYYIIESINKNIKFIAPSWILYDSNPSYEPKGKIIRTFENFKNYYE